MLNQSPNCSHFMGLSLYYVYSVPLVRCFHGISKADMHAPSGEWSWKVVLWLNIVFVAGDASCKSSTAENSFIGSLPALLPGTYYKQ